MTGGTGFLGKRLCAALVGQGHAVVPLSSKNCNLTQPMALSRYSDGAYDRIYHLAAWTQAGDFCLHHAGEQWIINQLINTNVLEWWQRCQPQARMISMGTSCAYAPDQEMAEENYLVGMPIDSLYTYAMTKRMLYVGMQALSKQFGVKYVHFVPSTLYGPGYHTDGRQMHFVFDLIRKILRGKLYGEPVVLWGDGYQKRELVYVEDFVGSVIALSDRDNELINIGAGQEFTIRHFAGVICQKVGFDAESVTYDTSRYVGARSKCLSVRRLRSLLPGLEFTPLEHGLGRTIEWFAEDRARLQ